jgi:hypothetical protein
MKFNAKCPSFSAKCFRKGDIRKEEKHSMDAVREQQKPAPSIYSPDDVFPVPGGVRASRAQFGEGEASRGEQPQVCCAQPHICALFAKRKTWRCDKEVLGFVPKPSKRTATNFHFLGWMGDKRLQSSDHHTCLLKYRPRDWGFSRYSSAVITGLVLKQATGRNLCVSLEIQTSIVIFSFDTI